MEKKTQNKDAELQQPKGIILYPALADSLVGKVAGLKKTKQNQKNHTHTQNKNKKTHAQPTNNQQMQNKETLQPHAPTPSTGILTCWQLYSS